MDIFIENSTEDDATVTVSPGGIGKDEGPKNPRGQVKAPAPAATKAIGKSTEDDATVTVSPGGIGKDKAEDPATTKTIVRAKSKETVSLPSCPSCVVHFMVEVGSHHVKSPTVKGLKLTGSDNGYRIEEIRNGTRRRKA